MTSLQWPVFERQKSRQLELHGPFITGYGPLRVEDCLICHGNSFADGIHSLHLYAASFTELGGNCESCHAVL